MGAGIGRITLGSIGVAAIVIGAGAAGAGAWIVETIGDRDALRSSTQVIDVPGCTTAVMEVADARVDFDPLDGLTDVDVIRDRTSSLLTVRVDGITSGPWLVGVGDQADVEERLLGARYCLIEVRDGTWSSVSIAVDPDSPDVDLSGVAGRWAITANGESVALPVPTGGSSVVVSGSGDSSMTTIDVAAEYRITGASQAGLVALIAGISTVTLGVALLVVSVAVLRNKGQHEGSRP